MMKSSLFMPEDLLILILEYLHVNSLLRFKCVSKSWCNLIKSPMFVNCHLQKQKQVKNGRVLLVTRCVGQKWVFSFHDLASPGLEQVGRDIPIPDNINGTNSFVTVIGSCNGIVCLIYDQSIVLCNPALGEFNCTPYCPVASKPGFYGSKIVQTRWGFCSNTIDSFIVVQLQCTYTIRHTVIEGFLYDSGTNLWRKIKNKWKGLHLHLLSVPNCDIFFKGACHWPDREIGPPCLILTLDVSNDKVGILDCPVWPTEYGDWVLKVMDECLALGGYSSSKMEVWVMKEYGVKESWTKQLVFELNHITRPLVFLKNDVWILKESIADHWRSCEPNTDEIKRFGIRGSLGSFRALIHNQSLITLKLGSLDYDLS